MGLTITASGRARLDRSGFFASILVFFFRKTMYSLSISSFRSASPMLFQIWRNMFFLVVQKLYIFCRTPITICSMPISLSCSSCSQSRCCLAWIFSPSSRSFTSSSPPNVTSKELRFKFNYSFFPNYFCRLCRSLEECIITQRDNGTLLYRPSQTVI